METSTTTAVPSTSSVLEVQLRAHLSNFAASPFLFVGSGLSRRYLWLETWRDLLKRFCALAKQDIGYLSSRANGNLPELATLLAHHFHAKWWKGKQFADSRARFSETAVRLDSPLKIEIAEYVRQKSWDPDDAAMMAELSLLRQANVDGIITTNWDLLLERLFQDYTVYKGQKELLFSHPQSIGEIYKIHGCCTSPNSLILTTQDYTEFTSRNPYLAAKLLTIFVEHPVIFLGYSLSDANVREIIASIASCLDTDATDQLRDRLIFVEWIKDHSGEFQKS
jgi:hypothetical protein